MAATCSAMAAVCDVEDITYANHLEVCQNREERGREGGRERKRERERHRG